MCHFSVYRLTILNLNNKQQSATFISSNVLQDVMDLIDINDNAETYFSYCSIKISV